MLLPWCDGLQHLFLALNLLNGLQAGESSALSLDRCPAVYSLGYSGQVTFTLGFTPLGNNTFYNLAFITDTHKFFWNQAMSDVLATSVFLDRERLSVFALSVYSFIASRWAGQCQSLFRSLLFQVWSVEL